MDYPEKDHIALNKALEGRGWLREGNRLYAPHKTFWSEGVNNEYLPRPILTRMLEKMRDALEKMPQIEHHYPDKEYFYMWVEDMESMVNTLKELLEDEQNTNS